MAEVLQLLGRPNILSRPKRFRICSNFSDTRITIAFYLFKFQQIKSYSYSKEVIEIFRINLKLYIERIHFEFTTYWKIFLFAKF